MHSAKQLSRWAARNPKLAVPLLVALHTLVVFTSFKIGKLFYFKDVEFPYWPILVFGLVYLFAVLMYPVYGQKEGWRKYTYFRKKAYDFLVIFSTCMLALFGYNHFLSKGEPVATPEYPTRIMTLNNAPTERPSLLKQPLLSVKLKLKQVRTTIRQAGKEAKKAWKQKHRERDTGIKVVLTVLTILGMVGVFFIIAFLSCSISCNGNEGLAILIFFGGVIGIIIAGVSIIRRIWGKQKKKD